MQKAKMNKNNMEKQSWRTYITRYQDLIYSYSNFKGVWHWCKDRLIDQMSRTESRHRLTYDWSSDL